VNIVFIIRSLNVGGAERQLLVLAKGLAERNHKVKIITFYSGIQDVQLENSKVEIINLRKTKYLGFFKFLIKLIQELKTSKPDIIHGYLSTSNILASFSKLFFPKAKAVWGIRSSNMKLDNYGFTENLVFFTTRILSKFVDLVIYNSVRGREFHEQKYFKNNNLVIPNGIDTSFFNISEAAKKEFKEEFGLKDEYLIGFVARIDYIKDYPFFLNILKELIKRKFSFKAICIGTGEEKFKADIKKMASSLGLDPFMIWLDYRPLVKAYNAFDILCLTSFSEGFPNVICEAMACGTQCYAAFEAGEGPFILENSNYIFLNRSPREAADKIICNSQKIQSRDKIRAKIVEKYSIPTLINSTEKALSDLIHS
jgi:glycosyltransferase involved in cell wall biosynthesis